MRLIDADKLKKDLKSVTLSNGTLVNTNTMLQLLEKYPIFYDVDVVIKYLEELKDRFNKKDFAIRGIIEKAIEIVKAGGMNNNSKTSD